MATLRDIKQKISGVKKTKQITRAMNMVAAARLRSTQTKMENFGPYARKFSEVLGNLAGQINPDVHPLLSKREKISRVELLHFTADRGLCGSFNMNSINKAEKWIKEQGTKGLDVRLTLVGKKGRDYFRRKTVPVTAAHTNIYGTADISFVNKMTAGFIQRFMAGEIDEVYVLFSRFLSMARQEPTLLKLIPIEPPKQEGAEAAKVDYLYEPSSEQLLVDLLPKHISVQILNAFLQQETSEHAARMAAMDNATKNCSELIGSLTLIYNKARQAAITAELMDIVGGAEALRSA
ncbi:MAG: ATP synthase F1 subunit gamma [Deltaproteobacteria bacterium]|jgi:F-type H+-transporting ATPase subunit gamma|nr:ATP synthase F1 subunit gamma [Deltaproteobacteria bacterium]